MLRQQEEMWKLQVEERIGGKILMKGVIYYKLIHMMVFNGIRGNYAE